MTSSLFPCLPRGREQGIGDRKQVVHMAKREAPNSQSLCSGDESRVPDVAKAGCNRRQGTSNTPG